MDLSGEEKEYDSQEFKGLVAKNEQIGRKEFTNCTFVKCSFNETAFVDCRFRDCVFQKCELRLVTLVGCSFKNTHFDESQTIGINWTETTWAKDKMAFVRPVDFAGCVISHSTFLGLNMKKVTLSKCIAHNVSFENANLTQANCTATDFRDSRFLHTNLTETDFTGATNYAIAANLNTLKKTKFSLPEAMSLLYSLDIVLTE
jgi:uncharacterized protein YjbI with pentapeptide repeats